MNISLTFIWDISIQTVVTLYKAASNNRKSPVCRLLGSDLCRGVRRERRVHRVPVGNVLGDPGRHPRGVSVRAGEGDPHQRPVPPDGREGRAGALPGAGETLEVLLYR